MNAKKVYLIIFLLGIFYVFANFIVKTADAYTSGEAPEYADAEEAVEDSFPQKAGVREFYGLVNRVLSPNEIDRTVKDKDGYLRQIVMYDYDAERAIEKVAELRDVCAERGTGFAYVSFPSKSDGTDVGAVYGIDSNSESLRAELQNGLRDNGIDVLDIREEMEYSGLEGKDIFYKTDHHWTTKAGLFAAEQMARFLKEKGYNASPENLAGEKFTYNDYPNSWFGETGRKYSLKWVGALDDFTVIRPNYETSFDYSVPGSFDTSGDFSIFVYEGLINSEYNLYDVSLHYSYMSFAGQVNLIRNNNLPEGVKVLIVNDSFSMVNAPFLALGCGEVDLWDVRSNPESLYEHIKNSDYDIVMVAYTDFFMDEMYDFR